MSPSPSDFDLGRFHDDNRLAEFDARWAEAFREEAERLKAALGPVAVEVEHYGSTSIAGLAAKPIIDMLVGVQDLDALEPRLASLVALGYEDRGRDVVPGHHIFAKGTLRTHVAHIVRHRSDDWYEVLNFRDRLRASPQLRDEYEGLKRTLAARFPNDRRAYTAGKSEFVAAVLAAPPRPSGRCCRSRVR